MDETTNETTEQATEEKPATREGRNGGTLNNGPGPGRPKGSFSMIRLVREELEANGEESAKRLAKAMILQAAKGRSEPLRQIMDRIDGPIKQEVAVTGPNGGPLEVLTGALDKIYGAPPQEEADGSSAD